jgi:uncharacterized protein YecE (DUF72 family)
MILIGTSGWVYAHWRGRFSPPNLSAHDELRFYARHFPTVEINRSYDRLPTRAPARESQAGVDGAAPTAHR